MGTRKTAKAKAKGAKRRAAAARRAAALTAVGMVAVAKSAARVIVFQESQYATNQSTNTKAGRAKANLLFVVYEALRELGYYDHLLENDFEPMDPEFLDLGWSKEELADGCRPGIASVEEGKTYYRTLVKLAAAQKEEYTKADGNKGKRKQRDTTTILGTALASWPGDPKEEYAKPEFTLWLQLTIAFARKKYGEHLKGAILHRDEGALHVHLWYDNGGKNVKSLQAGQKAAAASLKAGGTSGDAGKACIAADQALLDEYHQVVGRHVGLARISDHPKPKMNRREYLEKQAEDKVEEIEKAVAKANRIHAGRKAQAGRTIDHLNALRQAKARAKQHLTPALYQMLFGNAHDETADATGQGRAPAPVKAKALPPAPVPVAAPQPKPAAIEVVKAVDLNARMPGSRFTVGELAEKLSKGQRRVPTPLDTGDQPSSAKKPAGPCG